MPSPTIVRFLLRGAIAALPIIVAVGLLSGPTDLATAAGNSITTPDAVGSENYASLELDAAGNPVVGYMKVFVGLNVLHCNDPDCAGGDESITTPDTAGVVGVRLSLELDAAGNPVVSYYDASNLDLKLLHCNDPNCAGGDESITSPDIGGDVGGWSSLALDLAGNPVVSYYDGSNSKLKVLHCNDPNCAGGDESITSPVTPGTYSSLALDAAGNPVVSYLDDGLKLLHCNDPNCVGGDESITSLDTGGSHNSLALDATGNPVVSYRDDGLKVLHCNDPNCAGGGESITSPDTDANVGWYTSLVLDTFANPVVSYYDFGNDDLKVLRCNDPSCAGGDESISTPDSAGNVGKETSLALDAAGNPVVSYRGGFDLKVLHCGSATCKDVQAPTPLPTPTPTATPFAPNEVPPRTEVKRLVATDPQAFDFFGNSVAVSGDTAVVGTREADADAGAAYVFQRGQGGVDNWGKVTKLLASDAEANDVFGWSVALSGDTLVVGAYGEDAGGNAAGAAYVFGRDEGGADNWGEVKKLTASDAQAEDGFGFSVALSADTLVVGAGGEDAAGSQAGAAYVFERDQGGADNWGEVEKLTASDAQADDGFGGSVAVGGDTAVVGAQGEDAGGDAAGAAYVFRRDQGGADNWGEVTKLTVSDAQDFDFFGRSVAVGGDTAVVGAVGKDTYSGAAYVFGRNEGGIDNWGEVKKLTASDAHWLALFGSGVAVGGDTVVVGAYSELVSESGTAYVFGRNRNGEDNWGEIETLLPSDAQPNQQFGISVALSDETAVVGARFDEAGGFNAGAAYVFQEPTVGGIAELPDVAGAPVQRGDMGGSAGTMVAAILAVATTAVALAGAAWYARRRRLG